MMIILADFGLCNFNQPDQLNLREIIFKFNLKNNERPIQTASL